LGQSNIAKIQLNRFRGCLTCLPNLTKTSPPTCNNPLLRSIFLIGQEKVVQPTVGAVPERGDRVVLASSYQLPPSPPSTPRAVRSGVRAIKHFVLLLLHTTHHHALLSALSITPILSILYPLIGPLVSRGRCPPAAQSQRLGPRPNGFRQTDRIFDQTQGDLSDALACSNPRLSTPESCCTAAYRPSNPKLGRLGLQRSSP
jgi:hypothetical protein